MKFPWSKPKSEPQKELSSYVYFNDRLVFPATAAEAVHELAAYRVDSRTQYLLPSVRADEAVIAAILRTERRSERRSLIRRVLTGDRPNFGLRLTANFTTLPRRSVTVFNFALQIEQEGYYPEGLLQSCCKFLVWHAQQIEADKTIWLAGANLSQVQTLKTGHALTRMYWATAIASKLAGSIGVR